MMKNVSIRILKALMAIVGTILFITLMIYFPMRGAIIINFRTQAENTAYNVKNSISVYFTEYRRYPVRTKVEDTTLDSDHALMDILLGGEKASEVDDLNPRRIVFYSDKAAKLGDDHIYRGGVTLNSDGGGELWDTWGNYYKIRLDTNLDNQVESPETPDAIIPESILVWSAGKDGKFETWKDNVKTW